MRQYLKHFFKKNVGLLLFLTLFCMIVYVAPLLVEEYYDWNSHPYTFITYQPSMYLGNIATALYLMAVFLPIMLFSYKMNKRSVDLYYSLPLSKRKILLVHFLTGLILLYVPYTFVYLVGFIIAAIKVNQITLIYYLYLYLSSLIPAFTAYSVTAFIFTRANTIWDGMIAVAGVYCIFMVGALAIGTIFDLKGRIDIYNFFPSSPIDCATRKFQEALFRNALMPYYNDPNLPYHMPYDPLKVLDVDVLIDGIIWTLLSVAATVALFVLEPRSRAENCGQISNSFFGCKILLPIYAFLFSVCTETDPLYFCIIVFAAYALAAVYKRRFRIGRKFAIVLLCCLVAGYGVSFLSCL